MAVGLLDLPNELLFHIGQISSDGVLYRLILTNRHLAELLNPILWNFPVGRNVHANLEPTDLPFACESKIDGPMELLSYAMATDNAFMARKLFDHDGLDYDDDPDTLHSTLRSAVEMGRVQWVDLLLATVEEQHRTLEHGELVSMIHAAMDGNELAIMERLLRHRAIHRRCWDSACKHAMEMRNEKLLSNILDCGKTDPPVGQTELSNLFCFAATMGHIPSLEVLYSRGAQINHPGPIIYEQVREPPALHAAASRNQTDAVAWMLDHGADINIKDYYERPVVDAAVGQLATLKLLISRGADIHRRSGRAWPPLVRAFCDGHRQEFLYLISLQGGLRPGFGMKESEYDKCIQSLAETRSTSMISLLLDQLDMPEGGEDIMFRTASYWGNILVLKAVMARGVSLAARRDSDTVLHYMAGSPNNWFEDHLEERNLAAAKFVLDRHPELVSEAGKEGNTPLHKAASAGRTLMAKLLSKRGGSLDAVNHHGQTPIDVVANYWGSKEEFKKFIER